MIIKENIKAILACNFSGFKDEYIETATDKIIGIINTPPPGDLISREALKEETKSFIDCDGFNPVWQIIDDAPTVDAIPNAEGYEMHSKGYLRGYERGKAEAKPRGKWLDHYCPMFDIPGIECSICSKEVRGWARHMPFPNFCPNCGADMREEGDT